MGRHAFSAADVPPLQDRYGLRVSRGGLRPDPRCGGGARVRRDHGVHAGEGWSIVDGFYVAVATLTTSSVLDPKLTVTEPWLKIFTALYVLVGIGIHVEVARRLGMGFIPSRDELAAEKLAKEAQADD